MITVLESLKLAKEYLEKHQIENPRLNAELLLSEILNCKRLELYTNFEKPLKDEEIQKFRDFLLRRAKGEPVQYITGKAYFYGLEFVVTPDVLIPRPETELLVEEVINSFDKNESLKIVDLCSGSGNIGITLAKFFPNSIVDCIDISEKAIEIGKLNAERLNVKNVSFIQLDILKQQLSEVYDVIVSNPPYISIEKQNEIQKEVRLYEPRIALFVDDELKFYRRILELSDGSLKNKGRVFLEIDNEISQQVFDLMKEKNFASISIKKDFANLNRIIWGVKEK
ncbi:MAG: peptide chain release factor N(5)-glutamine methyltransferase [Ignavibacteria bacterium]|jgi:release factor glutamine methyltransferase|nr:peptide chain release factor N(5)-glutamine methyltransferase [Ignavibacteria bacterium]MDH7527030.1 peptide chain release factor N(5)-glutamine methyltransferase [Ignavibacteria bacterium]NPV10825.1 peptide chain release factor N(5)-glutamine methyltransferase [Ignavibacteria bacterium]